MQLFTAFTRRILFVIGTALVLANAVVAQVPGQFPSKPVKIIASFPPGQATDVGARLVANGLSNLWGQSVIVENQAGGLGVPAMQSLHNAPKDGYTLGVGTTGTMATNVYLLSKLPYDPLRDFEIIAPLFTAPLVLLTTPSSPFKTLGELIEQAKKQPNALTWAIPGIGSAQQLAGERLFQMAGVELNAIPYKGSAPAVQDLMGGQVMLMFDAVGAAMPLIQSKKLVPLAVTTKSRIAQLADVPTIAESGFDGYDANGWAVIIAPAGTPKAVTDKIGADMRTVLAQPELSARFVDRALYPDIRSANEWKQLIKDQIEVIATTLRSAKVPRQ